MNMVSYIVRCLNCGGSNRAMITERKPGVEYIINLNDDHKANPDKIAIISGRYRPDMQFGWECGRCGNYSLVAPQEEKDIELLVTNGGASALEKIKTSLTKSNEQRFHMEKA